MQRFRPTPRGYRRVAGGALALALVLALVVAFWGLTERLPTRESMTPAREVYAEFFATREALNDVRIERPPPSVLEGAAGFETLARETPTVSRFEAPVAWMQIDRLGLRAVVVTLNLKAGGDMAPPDAPDLVAWYDFSGKPGLGGNAVFAGYEHWGDGAAAAFADLDALAPDDTIAIGLADGTVLVYAVTASHRYTDDALDVRVLLAPTRLEALTLITIGGESGDRLVVRAVKTKVIRPS